MLLVDKRVDIVHGHFVPGFAATGSKLAHIADVVDDGISDPVSAFQILGELRKFIALIHDELTFGVAGSTV
jgi:hypothetical protein